MHFSYFCTMSLVKHTNAACCKCGATADVTIYKSINVSENPELKEKVLDGSIFVYQCPQCGQANLAKYETLYHDPDKKIMIWLCPGGEKSESEMRAIANHAKAMGDYTLRMVEDVRSLMEKVYIFEAGLDDVVIEMCKYVTRAEMAAKAGEEQATQILNLPMHFYKKGEQEGVEYITLSFPDNGKMVGCNIGFNVYEDCLGIIQRNPHIKADGGFVKVDSAWLSSILS